MRQKGACLVRFDAGTIEIQLNIEKGRIAAAKIYGDFFGTADVSQIEEKLVGVPYEQEAVLAVLESIPFEHYFGKMDAASLSALFFS